MGLSCRCSFPEPQWVAASKCKWEALGGTREGLVEREDGTWDQSLMKGTIRVSIFGKPLSAYHSLGVVLYVAATVFSRDASALDGGAWFRGAGNSG